MVDAWLIFYFLPIKFADSFVIAAFVGLIASFALPLIAIVRAAFSEGGIDLFWRHLLVLAIPFVGPRLPPVIQVVVYLASFRLQVVVCSCVFVGRGEH